MTIRTGYAGGTDSAKSTEELPGDRRGVLTQRGAPVRGFGEVESSVPTLGQTTKFKMGLSHKG